MGRIAVSDELNKQVKQHLCRQWSDLLSLLQDADAAKHAVGYERLLADILELHSFIGRPTAPLWGLTASESDR